jgi:hypothetical protein
MNFLSCKIFVLLLFSLCSTFKTSVGTSTHDVPIKQGSHHYFLRHAEASTSSVHEDVETRSVLDATAAMGQKDTTDLLAKPPRTLLDHDFPEWCKCC